jgi:hypothetical protein
MILALTLMIPQDEVVKRVDRFGEQTKILTSGQIDAWVFEGKKGEIVMARVASDAFDPVLELVDDKESKLAEVDDPGSQSRFTAELPRDAVYRVRVRAFKDSGGGRYALLLDRFLAPELAMDASATGTLGHEGRGFHRFQAKSGELVGVRLTSAIVSEWEVLDPKGQPVRTHFGLARIEKTGPHYVRVNGPAGNSYGISLRAARIASIKDEAPLKSEVSEELVEGWDVAANPGDLVLVDIRRSGLLHVDLDHVPDEKADEGVVPSPTDLEKLRVLARYEKGGRHLTAAILGRKGSYRILVKGSGAAKTGYEIRTIRTLPRLAVGDSRSAELPLGEFALYEMALKPGQVASVELTTDRFDSALTLFNRRGDVLAANDDRGLELSSRLTHMARDDSKLFLLATSRGQGGGGGYSLTAKEQPVEEAKWGARNEGNLGAGGVDIWRFKLAKDQVAILSAASRVFDVQIQVLDPRGVEVARDDNGGTETNSLLALRGREEGIYTIWVSSPSGHGAYGLRLMQWD